jgi:hypothetical protein
MRTILSGQHFTTQMIVQLKGEPWRFSLLLGDPARLADIPEARCLLVDEEGREHDGKGKGAGISAEERFEARPLVAVSGDGNSTTERNSAVTQAATASYCSLVAPGMWMWIALRSLEGGVGALAKSRLGAPRQRRT